ncbi:hypothetical protein TRIP_B200267 [uncultured Desulfatiglans sp.]|nr:hypothetical protein TRIP_B200267 [uncultured Desulfatiglans sp.]
MKGAFPSAFIAADGFNSFRSESDHEGLFCPLGVECLRIFLLMNEGLDRGLRDIADPLSDGGPSNPGSRS